MTESGVPDIPDLPDVPETAEPVGASRPAAASMRRDLISAYAAAAAKAASWAIVSAITIRIDRGAFALLALVRGTIGLLNYTSLGLGPSMIRLLTAGPQCAQPVSPPPASGDGKVLSYATPIEADETEVSPLLRPYSNGITLALVTGTVAFLLTAFYAGSFPTLHALPPGFRNPVLLVVGMGLGMLLRLMSDAPAAVLQTEGLIAEDNRFIVLAELSWVVLTAFAATAVHGGPSIAAATGITYAFSGMLLLLFRLGQASQLVGQLLPDWRLVTPKTLGYLLGFGALVTVAQLADFLYAPTDFILINRLIDPNAVAIYAPAVQIDAGLLLLVSGVAAVLLPRTALAHAAGNRATVRRYYVRGTLASTGMLLLAAAVVWAASPWLLRAWLGQEMPQTGAILPLVLIHTVVGGSSAVGRSVLLAMGRVKPFTAAVLVAGVLNVLLSYAFVRYFGLGLKGIIFGTLVAVIGRCAFWMPWYVSRVLRQQDRQPEGS